MNNINIKLHYYQKSLIKKLTLTDTPLKFNQLLIDGLESEHMNYHLKQLIQIEFIQKIEDGYILTSKGKDYCNLMDDEMKVVEKQPKTSIIIRGLRKNGSNNIEYLVCRRLRQPYFGKVGWITGKVHFGETFENAAKRELYEETGLEASTLVLEKIYRKIRMNEDGTHVQDVIFYIFHVTNFSGEIIEKTEFQENLWATKDAILKMDVFDDISFDERMEPSALSILESEGIADGF